MKINKSWFSIIIWMWLVLLMTLTAFVILSYMVPFSRSVKWIENASNSYYVSYSWIEKALYYIKTRSNISSETWSTMPATAVWYSYNTFSSWGTIPLTWSWNSEYDKDYNTISPTEPLQIQVWSWYLTNPWSWIQFYFRVPDLDGDSFANDETLSWNTLPIINWMLSSENDTLIASWTYIDANGIKKANCSWTCDWKIDWQAWLVLSWSAQNFDQTYYNNNCWTNSWCSLKFSIINPLELNDASSTKLPYLEYKITWLSSNFPDRYTKIKSSWKSYWFQKNLEVKIPQQTVNQALDFTIFQ